MKTWHGQLAAILAFMGVFVGSAALAQSRSGTAAKAVRQPVVSPDALPGVDAAVATYLQDEDKKKPSPFHEEQPAPPASDEAYQATDETPPAQLPTSEASGESECGPATCDDIAFDSCESPCVCRRPLLKFGGWLDQGITGADRGSLDRFNGPVTFNDREGEYQLNQLYFFSERVTQTDGCGWDIGGRADVFYGTDWRFVQARGLETRWNESERFYGLALPQVYMDLAYNNLTVRMGKFYSIVGYESVMAPNNFFYSHSYTHQYGEPFTSTGVLGKYKLGDTVSISAGFDRGWNNWEDNNGNLDAFWGAAWTSCDERTSLAFTMDSGAWDDAGQYNRTVYSLVFTRKVTSQFTYALEHDLGMANDSGIALPGGGLEDGAWYSLVQYFYYAVNERWDMGMRFEWFQDVHGTQVGGIGPPHGWELGPNVADGHNGWAGNFYELTAGFHWKPREYLILRPECRWDWYRGAANNQNQQPYGFGARRDQFTFGADLIVKF